MRYASRRGEQGRSQAPAGPRRPDRGRGGAVRTGHRGDTTGTAGGEPDLAVAAGQPGPYRPASDHRPGRDPGCGPAVDDRAGDRAGAVRAGGAAGGPRRAGRVERRGDPADRRVALVALTTAGAELLRAQRRAGAGALIQLIDKLPADEAAALAAAIPVLRHLRELDSERRDPATGAPDGGSR